MRTRHKVRGVAVAALITAVAVLALVGCETTEAIASSVSTSTNIKNLDDKAEALYKEKLAATGDAVKDTNKKLGALAIEAARQGDAATDNAASAVSLYRIAATAAWVAGPPHNTRLPGLSNKGSGACERAGGNAAQSRDCAVVRMIPSLALLDVKADSAQKLRDAGSIPRESLDGATKLTEEVSTQIQKVLELRKAALPLPESLDQYLQINLGREFCMLEGLLGQLDENSPPQPMLDRASAATRNARRSLEDASMSTTCH